MPVDITYRTEKTTEFEAPPDDPNKILIDRLVVAVGKLKAEKWEAIQLTYINPPSSYERLVTIAVNESMSHYGLSLIDGTKNGSMKTLTGGRGLHPSLNKTLGREVDRLPVREGSTIHWVTGHLFTHLRILTLDVILTPTNLQTV